MRRARVPGTCADCGAHLRGSAGTVGGQRRNGSRCEHCRGKHRARARAYRQQRSGSEYCCACRVRLPADHASGSRCAKCAAGHRVVRENYRRQNMRNGRCAECGGPTMPGKRNCEQCRRVVRERQTAERRRRRQEGRCLCCGGPVEEFLAISKAVRMLTKPVPTGTTCAGCRERQAMARRKVL